MFDEPKPERRVSFETHELLLPENALSRAEKLADAESQTRFFSDGVYCSAPEDIRCNGECRLTLPKARADVVRALTFLCSRDVWLTSAT